MNIGAKIIEIRKKRNMTQCGWPRKLDNLTWCKMPVKLTRKGRAFYEKVV